MSFKFVIVQKRVNLALILIDKYEPNYAEQSVKQEASTGRLNDTLFPVDPYLHVPISIHL